MDPDEGFCDDCAFLVAGVEFVRDTMGLPQLAAELAEARKAAVSDARRAKRLAKGVSSDGSTGETA